MSKWTLFLSCLATLVFTVGLSGCADSTDESTAPADQSQDTEDADAGHAHDEDDGHAHDDDDGHAHDEDADHDHAGHAHESSDVAELSPEDSEAAAKQGICPVSGEKLTAMGAPIKVDVNGRTVFICCDGCKEKLLADPDKYLAKLDQ